MNTFDNLGFTVHEDKSQFMPTQEIVYLGFVINSKEMTVRLTEERKQKLLQACVDLFRQGTASIRKVASYVGLMVSSLTGVPQGQLHYRSLERSKNKALIKHAGNWERHKTLSASDKVELKWWIINLPIQKGKIGVIYPVY